MARAKSLRSQPETEHYLHFVETVHLEDIALDSANFEINRDMFAEPQQSQESQGSHSAQVSVHQDLRALSRKSFSVSGNFQIAIKSVTGKDAVSISCRFSALFSLDREAEEQQVRRFVENEARVVFWPYVRQFVSDVTMRMSIPPLVLPLTSELKSHSRPSDRTTKK